MNWLFCLKWDPCERQERREKGVFRAAHPHTPILGQCPPGPKRYKTESHRASFFNRIVPLWNQLPLRPTVRSTVNMASFKSQLSFKSQPLRIVSEQISGGFQPRGGGVLSPESYVDVPAGPRKSDYLYTNFLPNFPPISIPFSKEKHPICIKLGAFYNNLPKIHPIYVIWAPSSLMKTSRSLYQISRKSAPKGRHIYVYHVNVRTIMFALGWHVASVLTVGRCRVLFCCFVLFCFVCLFVVFFLFFVRVLFCFVCFSLMGFLLMIFWLFQRCLHLLGLAIHWCKILWIVCAIYYIFWCLVNIPYFDVYFWLSMYSSDKV